MNHSRKKIYITAGVLTATLIAVILRAIALINDYDISVGYYENGAVLPTVFNAVCILSAIAIIGVSLFTLPKSEFKPPMRNTACRLASVLPALSLVLIAVNRLQALSTMLSYGGFGKQLIISFLSFIFALSATVFFITVCAGAKKNLLTTISGLFTIFFFLVELFSVYTDMTVAMNSPNKTLFYFAALSSALFILAELRILWGDKSHNKASSMSQYLAVLLTGAYAIPGLVFALKLKADLLADFNFFFAAIFILATVRVITLALSKENEEEERHEPEVEETEEAPIDQEQKEI